MSSPVLPLTGTELSQNPGIPVFGGNPSSYVRVAGSGNITSVLPIWKPYLVSLIIGTEVSHDLGIPAFVDNPVESVLAVGRNNTSFALPD